MTPLFTSFCFSGGNWAMTSQTCNHLLRTSVSVYSDVAAARMSLMRPMLISVSCSHNVWFGFDRKEDSPHTPSYSVPTFRVPCPLFKTSIISHSKIHATLGRKFGMAFSSWYGLSKQTEFSNSDNCVSFVHLALAFIGISPHSTRGRGE